VAVKDWNRIKQHQRLGSGTVSLLGLVDGTEKPVTVALEPRGLLHLCLRFDDYQCLFGLPLADVCSRDGSDVPLLVRECCAEVERRGLTDVGLYRVSGNQAVVKQLRDAFIKNPRSVSVRAAAWAGADLGVVVGRVGVARWRVCFVCVCTQRGGYAHTVSSCRPRPCPTSAA
jgi:hypothetical protein